MLKLQFDQEFLNGRKVFFTSDLHFYHLNIIRLCNRPFIDINDMNSQLIKNWNNVVSYDDIVFILGDFSYGYKKQWKKLLQSLNGNKYLILGNHDKDDCIPYELFEQTCDLLQLSIQDENLKWHTFICSHRPILSYEGMFRDWKQLYGHVHTRENSTGNDAHLLQYLVNSYDVGVDNNNFTPISFNEILTKF